MQQTSSPTAPHPLVLEVHQLVAELRVAEFNSGLLDGDSELSTRKRDIADGLDSRIRAKLRELEQRLLAAEHPGMAVAGNVRKDTDALGALHFPPYLRFALGRQATPLQEAYILFRYERPWVAFNVLRERARKRDAADRAAARRIGEIQAEHPHRDEHQAGQGAAGSEKRIASLNAFAWRAGCLGLVLAAAAAGYMVW